MLHITNGDSVVGTFRQVRFPGTYLSWQDVLHDGPVPDTETLNELSDVRAQALASFGWGDYDKIRAGFAARDQALENSGKQDEVVLWFEHDLYDQLQLLQLLDWFANHDRNGAKLNLIQVNSYPGVKPFHGLGQLSGPQLARLFPTRAPVTDDHLAAAREAWSAFRAPDPGALQQLAHGESSALPLLSAALMRFLQEYPGTTDGLSRTERQILQAAGTRIRKRQDIYFETQKYEDAPWGDASLYLRIDGLASGPDPALVEMQKHEFAITDAGQRLLEGKADWIALRGGLDVWLGGVHLSGARAQWRWDDQQKTLVSG